MTWWRARLWPTPPNGTGDERDEWLAFPTDYPKNAAAFAQAHADAFRMGYAVEARRGLTQKARSTP